MRDAVAARDAVAQRASRRLARADVRQDAAEVVALLEAAGAGRRVAQARVDQRDKAQRLLLAGDEALRRVHCEGRLCVESSELRVALD